MAEMTLKFEMLEFLNKIKNIAHDIRFALQNSSSLVSQRHPSRHSQFNKDCSCIIHRRELHLHTQPFKTK